MNMKRVLLCFAAGVALQTGIYIYLDQVLFATTADYAVSDVQKEKKAETETAGRDAFEDVRITGKAYYSYDNHYMADVSERSVTIYDADNLRNPQRVDLKGNGVSFFEWIPDRNLALMALYPADWKGGKWNVTLARYNPEGSGNESDAPIEDLPRDSKITAVAYSPATNAVYMKMQVRGGLYRIYRTDANYDTRRIYVQTSHVGTIAVFYDEDRFFYDDTEDNLIYLYNDETGGWRTISPPGDYRLVGVTRDKTLYAARLNAAGLAVEFYKGKLGVGFESVGAPSAPVEFDIVTMHWMDEMEESRKNAGNI